MGFRDVAAIEVGWEEGVSQINEREYLFVDSIREVEELTLELTVTEAKPQAKPPVLKAEPWLEQLLADGRPIERDVTCRVFRLTFDRNHMISYTVLNETYGKYPESPELFTGKPFRTFSWSHLLEFTRRTTHASNEHPGVLQHYQIACQNHVVDVICTGPPMIAVGASFLAGTQLQ
jgi:hypothetical protein